MASVALRLARSEVSTGCKISNIFEGILLCKYNVYSLQKWFINNEVLSILSTMLHWARQV